MAVIQAPPIRRLDLAGATPDGARLAIKALLEEEPNATRKVYAALLHQVWTILIERRLDDGIRDWHGLLQNVKTYLRGKDQVTAERLTALTDLLRESISLAESSPAKDLARRPNASRILALLLDGHPGHLPRREIQSALGLKTANLSNILTQLIASGLIERREVGKEAEFRLTALGRTLAQGPVANNAEPIRLDTKAMLSKLEIYLKQKNATPPHSPVAMTFSSIDGITGNSTHVDAYQNPRESGPQKRLLLAPVLARTTLERMTA